VYVDDPINEFDLNGQWGRPHIPNPVKAVSKAARSLVSTATRRVPGGGLGLLNLQARLVSAAAAVRQSARTAAQWTSAHRGLLATIGAGVACGFGPVACVAAQAAALAVRSQQRGITNWRANLTDLAVTSLTLYFVGGPAWQAEPYLNAGSKIALSVGTGLMTDAVAIANCVATGRTTSGC
jgi:hypothetical protein